VYAISSIHCTVRPSLIRLFPPWWRCRCVGPCMPHVEPGLYRRCGSHGCPPRRLIFLDWPSANSKSTSQLSGVCFTTLRTDRVGKCLSTDGICIIRWTFPPKVPPLVMGVGWVTRLTPSILRSFDFLCMRDSCVGCADLHRASNSGQSTFSIPSEREH